jgi:hypothetical protein
VLAEKLAGAIRSADISKYSEFARMETIQKKGAFELTSYMGDTCGPNGPVQQTRSKSSTPFVGDYAESDLKFQKKFEVSKKADFPDLQSLGFGKQFSGLSINSPKSALSVKGLTNDLGKRALDGTVAKFESNVFSTNDSYLDTPDSYTADNMNYLKVIEEVNEGDFETFCKNSAPNIPGKPVRKLSNKQKEESILDLPC